MQKLKLNIGCGLNAPAGWVNIDSSLNARLAKWPRFKKMLTVLHIIPLHKTNIPYPKNIYIYDVRRGLPFPDNSTDAIYCSHLLEHLNRKDALYFIKECYRVLSTGGIMRIIVPDLAQYIEQYMKEVRQRNKNTLVKEPASDRFLEDLCLFEKESANENIFTRLYKKIYDKNIHKWMYDEYSLTALLLKYGFHNIQRKGCYESMIKDIETLDEPNRFNSSVCLETQKR